MRLYGAPPDPEEVNRHFVRMAKGELKGQKNGQVGFGVAGSRLTYDGASTLQRGVHSPQVTVKHVTPTEVGIQQARSQLMAGELKKTAAGRRIKKLLTRVSKQKSSGRGRSKKGSGKIVKRRKKTQKSNKKKKKKNKKKSGKKQKGKSRRADNFS